MALALILAAGRGERLGASVPKALVPLRGRPLMQWSVEVMLSIPRIEQVVVALPAGVSAPAGTVGVIGGAVRSESVRNALVAGQGDPVIVHDAARPLVSEQIINGALDALEAEAQIDAVIAAAPVTDTIKQVSDGIVQRTLDRSSLWAVQTPQVFRRSALERALDVQEEVLAAATDDAWLIERAGGKVRVLQAPVENMKVTSPSDLTLAGLLIDERESSSS